MKFERVCTVNELSIQWTKEPQLEKRKREWNEKIQNQFVFVVFFFFFSDVPVRMCYDIKAMTIERIFGYPLNAQTQFSFEAISVDSVCVNIEAIPSNLAKCLF